MILAWLLGPRRKSKGTRHKPFSPPRARLRLEALEDRTVPAWFVVTRGTGVATDVGSLPWAIVQVNNSNDASNTISFQSDVRNVTLTEAMAPILKDVTIVGLGKNLLTVMRSTGDEVPHFSIFAIATDTTVTIQDMTIMYGWNTVGGGINNLGTLTVNEVSLSGNKADLSGGAIYNEHNATLNLNGGDLSFNTSYGTGGGGLYNADKGTAHLAYYVLITRNAVLGGGFGGGIDNLGTMTILDEPTISNNSAEYGGGISNAGNLTMTSGWITGNSADLGGGIYSSLSAATASFSYVSISSNGANKGGGAYADAGTISLDHCTIMANSATLGSGGAWKRVNGVDQGHIAVDPSCTKGPDQTFVPDGV